TEGGDVVPPEAEPAVGAVDHAPGAGADDLVAEAQHPAGAADRDLLGVPLPAVAPLDGHRALERLGLGRLPGPVEQVDGAGLRPRRRRAGQRHRRAGRRHDGQRRGGRQAGHEQAGGPHGPKRTGTAMGASWLSGSPVTEAVAAWESASDGSFGSTSGSRGRRTATTAAAAATAAHASRRRRPAGSPAGPDRGAQARDSGGPVPAPISGRGAEWTGSTRMARRAAATSSSSVRQAAQAARWASAS